MKVLWANFYCLLDDTSGGAISIRQILEQLSGSGYVITSLGTTVFESENGRDRFIKSMTGGELPKQPVFRLLDGLVDHYIISTESGIIDKLTSAEISEWYQKYKQLLSQFRPDIVLSFGGRAIDQLTYAEARRMGVPTVAYVVNHQYLEPTWAVNVTHMLTDSHATAELYKQKMGWDIKPFGKFITVPTNAYEQKGEFRAHLGKFILFINPSPIKGAFVFAKVAELLSKRRPDIKFVVVNSRETWSNVKAYWHNILDQPPFDPNVVQLKAQKNLCGLIGAAHAVLSPSVGWESGSRVLGEAMLMGTPVVASDVGGNAEMIGNGGLTFSIPNRFNTKPYVFVPEMEEVEEVVQHLELIWDSDLERERLSKNCTRVVDNVHDIDKNSQALVAWLNEITDRVEEKQVSNGLFIDCGGFDGCSVIKFLLDYPGFDAVTFEPNPVFKKFYENIPTKLKPLAVASFDGPAAFYINAQNPQSSSLHIDKFSNNLNLESEHRTKVTVQCIRLSNYIFEQSQVYSDIYLKLDVEGSEYEILEDLLDTGAINHVSRLYMEFHDGKIPNIPSPAWDELKHRVSEHLPIKEWDGVLGFAVVGRGEKAFLARNRQLNVISERSRRTRTLKK